jgi:processive 1,2-diacylglycerol beta-glucosyltransferase
MKLLILHASAGNGHPRAAEALAAAAPAAGHTAVVRDILDFAPALFRKTYAEGYLNIVRSAPELWGYFYAQSDRKAQRPVDRRVRTVFNKLNAHSIFGYLNDEKPDAVLCTHFMPLEMIASLHPHRRHNLPLFGIVTDYAVHALWYCDSVNAYYVATEEARRQLHRKGQPASGIALTGIPVMPDFATRTTPAAGRTKLGLNPDVPAVLVLSGGYGVGPTVEMLRACAAEPPHCQVLVVAGKNAEMEQAAKDALAGSKLISRVYGFVRNVHELMDASDLIISKPGGLSTAEALAKGRPMMIVEPIPGQEQRNAEWLLENGAAVRLHETADTAWKLGALLADPARLAALAARAAALGRPAAAAEILADVVRRV